MGLGKTITMISLVMSDKESSIDDEDDDDDDQPRANARSKYDNTYTHTIYALSPKGATVLRYQTNIKN
jgi:hypothetical protein